MADVTESERGARAQLALERRRDADLLAFNTAKVDAQGFLDLHHDQTLTFPLLREAKSVSRNLQNATSQLEHDSVELMSKISDSALLAEERAFLTQNLTESSIIANKLSSFIESWETELMSDQLARPLPESEQGVSTVDTPMRRKRAEAAAALTLREETILLTVPKLPNRTDPLSMVLKSAPRMSSCRSVYDTPLRRRRLKVSSTPAAQVLMTPMAVKRSRRPEPSEHPVSSPAKDLNTDPRGKTRLNSDAKEFFVKIPTKLDSHQELRSPPPPNRTTGSMSQQSMLMPPGASQTRTSPLPDNNCQQPAVHSPTCVACKRARAKFHILRLKFGLARDLVASPSEKSDRDRVKDQMNRLLVELEDLADEDLFDLLSDAHAMIAEVTIMFAQFDSQQKATLPPERESRDKIDDKRSSYVNFKPFAIPKFDDTFRGYAEFKSKFASLVSDRMDEELALLRLKEECLTSKSVAHQLSRGKTTLKEAWSALDAHFGRASVIKDAVLRDIQEFKQVKSPTDVKGLRELLAAIISAKEDLDRAEMSHAMGDSAFSVLMTKIPYQIRMKIDGKIYDTWPSPSSNEQVGIYLSTLERHTAIQETHSIRTLAHVPRSSSSSRSPSNDNKDGESNGKRQGSDPSLHVQSSGDDKEGEPDKRESDHRDDDPEGKGKQRSRGRGANSGDRPRYCSFHPDATTHATLYCPTTVNLSSQELESKVSSKKLCRLCFGSHPTADCRSSRYCPEPNCANPRNHNKLLHVAASIKQKDRKLPQGGAESKPEAVPRDAVKQGEDAPPQNSSTQSTISSSDFLEKKPSTVTERDDLNSQLGFNTVRPSHHAYLKGKSGELFSVSVLYDAGGDLTQVTKYVASKSSSVPFNSLPNLRISAAGDRSPKDWGKADLYDLPVYDALGNCMFNVKCISVDNIGFMKAATVEEVCKTFESRGHDISDVLQPAQGCIDLLIGCNYANHQPQPVETIETVTLATTKFGKLLYGAHPSFPPDSEYRSEPSSCLLSVCTDHTAILQDLDCSEPEDPRTELVCANSTAFMKCCPCVHLATSATLSKPERVEIQRLAHYSEFYPIESSPNIADDATRKVGSSNDLDSAMEVRHRDPRMTINRGVSSHRNFSVPSETPEHLSTKSRIRASRRVAHILHFLQIFAMLLCCRNLRASELQSLQASDVSKWISTNDQFCPTPHEMTIAASYWMTRYQRELSDGEKPMNALDPLKSVDGLWRFHGRTSTVQKLPVIVPSGTPGNVLLRHFDVPTHTRAHTTLANTRMQYGASNVSLKLRENVHVSDLKDSLCGVTEWLFVPSGVHSSLEMAERSANDLLLGRSSVSADPGPVVDPLSELPSKFRDLFHQKETFLRDFCQKWQKVVSSTLMPRCKWLQSGRPVAVGDLVLIRDTNSVRGNWSWGEAVQVYHSLDHQSRRALLRYKTLASYDGKPVLQPSKSKLVTKSVRNLCPIMRVEDRSDQ